MFIPSSSGARGILAYPHSHYQDFVGIMQHTHRELSKLYRRLQSVEEQLEQRRELHLTRRNTKILQWRRAMAKRKARNLEAVQAELHELLTGANSLPVECRSLAYPVLPSPAYPFTPSPYTHLSASPFWPEPSLGVEDIHTPTFWDLSMLRERRFSATRSSPADSGYCEPAMYARPFELEEEPYNENHIYSHEIMNPPAGSMPEFASTDMPLLNTENSVSKRDYVPDLRALATFVPRGDEQEPNRSNKRRYSEAAMQLIDHRLALSRVKNVHHRRGNSIPVTGTTAPNECGMHF